MLLYIGLHSQLLLLTAAAQEDWEKVDTLLQEDIDLNNANQVRMYRTLLLHVHLYCHMYIQLCVCGGGGGGGGFHKQAEHVHACGLPQVS